METLSSRERVLGRGVQTGDGNAARGYGDGPKRLRSRSHLPDGRRGRPRVSLVPAAVLAQQYPLERLPEHLVENGVKHRVDHGTGVTEPRDQVDEALVGVGLAIRTHGRQQVEREKRRPQEHEREEHNAQHLGGLLLQPDDAAVPVRVPDHDARPVGAVVVIGRPLQRRRRRRRGRLLRHRQVQCRAAPLQRRVPFSRRGQRPFAYQFLRHGPAQRQAGRAAFGHQCRLGRVRLGRPLGHRFGPPSGRGGRPLRRVVPRLSAVRSRRHRHRRLLRSLRLAAGER